MLWTSGWANEWASEDAFPVRNVSVVIKMEEHTEDDDTLSQTGWMFPVFSSSIRDKYETPRTIVASSPAWWNNKRTKKSTHTQSEQQ